LTAGWDDAKLRLMAMERIRHVTIIGVGLLGGSLGLAIKRRCGKVHVAGVGRRRSSLKQALDIGAIDSAHLDARQAVAESDLVVLATPVGGFEGYLRIIAPLLKRGAIVTDVGSTKSQVVKIAGRILGAAGPFVASHPLAGSDKKGPQHARADLFQGATCILTPTGQTPVLMLRRIERFWKTLGMRTVNMPPHLHDRVMARVSHLPHAAAVILMLLPGEGDLALSATGLRDMTRLASGDAEVWRDVLLTNRREMLSAIDRFDELLMRLRDLIDVGDGPGIHRLLQRAKNRREGTIARLDQ